MAISSANAAAAPKVRKVETLTSGTSWTVPTGVEFVNALLVGGGGGGGTSAGSSANFGCANPGSAGTSIETTVTTTPGNSIAYAIGAGGASATAGGTTTFTGATSASGGSAGSTLSGGSNTGNAGRMSFVNNGGFGGSGGGVGGAGGSGFIRLEYWV